MHVETFLRAHLQRALPARRVVVSTGLFGNLAGTLESPADAHAIAIVIEWSDLDPRLSFREAGAWGPAAVTDIVSTAASTLDRLATAIERMAGSAIVAVVCPTLPKPPLFHTAGAHAAEAELRLDAAVMQFAARIAALRYVRVSSAARLAEISPAADRYHPQSDLLAGFPYSVPHAAEIGSTLAALIAPPPPKKGLITDLDDTLWSGIVGEIGVDAIAWDLTSHQQIHGLYQKLLCSLSQEGVLIGIASRNDPAVVDQAFQRDDLLLPAARVFPIHANWNAKSNSVGEILSTWNIAADSVVFVDDSPLELAEVAAAHPGIECIQFPKGDYRAAFTMLRRLRDLFGRPHLAEEDTIRLESLRNSAAIREAAAGGSAPEEFLQGLGASVRIDFQLPPPDSRPLELINKTNQFNLNGKRYTDAEWSAALAEPGAFLAVVSYQDKFGPLGKIAVVQGAHCAGVLRIRSWVMSCRAFARRIEHQCLRVLFERFGAKEIVFEFTATARNGPLREWIATYLGEEPKSDFALSQERFAACAVPLYHGVEITS